MALGTEGGTDVAIALGTIPWLFYCAAIAFGILLRCLFIRWYATLRHLPTGLSRLPQNWREALLVIDLIHPPELLPQAGRVDTDFTVGGIWDGIQAGRVDTDLSVGGIWDGMYASNRFDLITRLIFIPALYLPALAYRWSLKASAWLWWPLALALSSPLEGLDGQISREKTARSVSGAWRLLLPLIPAVVFAWLILSDFPGFNFLLHILPKEAGTLANELLVATSPPPFGVRYVALWLGCALALVFWWRTKNLKASHGKVLESPKEFNDLPDVDKARFLQLARPIERHRMLLIVTLLVLGEAYALSFFHSVEPQLAERFFAPWLLRVL